MAKLYYRYGTVESAKTLNLLAVAHNYKNQGRKILVLAPSLDDRYGVGVVKSRAGIQTTADVLATAGIPLNLPDLSGYSCVLVDESQFLSPAHIDALREVATILDVPVICYGLRADFRGNLFPGSQRLLAIADTIEEIKTVCRFCESKATQNLRLEAGTADMNGPQVQIGGSSDYAPVCWKHFTAKDRK